MTNKELKPCSKKFGGTQRKKFGFVYNKYTYLSGREKMHEKKALFFHS